MYSPRKNTPGMIKNGSDVVAGIPRYDPIVPVDAVVIEERDAPRQNTKPSKGNILLALEACPHFRLRGPEFD